MYLQQIKCFKKTYLQQLDPVNDWFMLAVRVTLASLVAALLASSIIHQQGMFLILGTIFFMLTNPDATKKQQLMGMVLAGVLGSVGAFLATIASQSLLLLLLVTAIYALISSYANRIDPTYGMAGLLALLLVITAGGIPATQLAATERLLNCLIGLGIGLMVTFILLPKQPARRLKRVLLVLLSDMTDYFYHISADCLRGNHINPRHWQIKERILLTQSKTNLLVKALKPDADAAVLLKKLWVAEEELLRSLLPLASVMTSPSNNAAFINILPALAQFSTMTYALMDSYKKYLQQPSMLISGDNAFLIAINNLQQIINTMIDSTLEKPIIYQWPFDIVVFSYLLTAFTQAMLNLQKVLVEITK